MQENTAQQKVPVLRQTRLCVSLDQMKKPITTVEYELTDLLKMATKNYCRQDYCKYAVPHHIQQHRETKNISAPG